MGEILVSEPEGVAALRRPDESDKLAGTGPEWRNGRRGGLKIRWSQGRVGSTPSSGTIESPNIPSDPESSRIGPTGAPLAEKRMKRWVTIILAVFAVLVIASAYDFWRGYHEEHSVGAAFAYAIVSWIVYGIPIFFVSWLFSRNKDK